MKQTKINAWRLCAESYDHTARNWTDAGDNRFTVRVIDGVAYICIRGTNNLDNVRDNLKVWPARSPHGALCHRGFLDVFKEIWPHISQKLLHLPDTVQLIATGHSLGGAVATLLAERLGCKVISFGSPRVYVRFWPAPVLDHIRIVRDDDPVPRLPAILYTHRTPALTIQDNDAAGIELGDHAITGYNPAKLETV